MTTFENGPAHGVVLALKRIPLPKYLRVVQNAAGKIDALDLWEDQAEADEVLFAYQMHGEQSYVHLNMGGGRGGFYAMATYRYIENQPPDVVMRDNAEWRKWATKNGTSPKKQADPAQG